MTAMASRDAFDGFTFAALFSPPKIPVLVAVMTSPSLIESSKLFFPIKNPALFKGFYDNCMMFSLSLFLFLDLLVLYLLVLFSHHIKAHNLVLKALR